MKHFKDFLVFYFTLMDFAFRGQDCITENYRVGQINPQKFQMVGNTHTKRNCNICFIQVIVCNCISQDIVMFHQSMKIIEWSKRKETLSPNYAHGSQSCRHSGGAEISEDDRV